MGDESVASVVPVAIFQKRLWQCMDILVMFHVDYLNSIKNQSQVNYPLPDGTMIAWDEWKTGLRPEFKGTTFNKILYGSPDESSKNFDRYLNSLFAYSGTQTFYHYYKDIPLKNIAPGDFITKKGNKGHAVLIVDMAENAHGEKVALIGQGDTPAVQFYLLKNKNGSPWFKIDESFKHPELPIKKKMFWDGLRRFPE